MATTVSVLKATAGVHRYSSAQIVVKQCNADGTTTDGSWFVMPYSSGNKSGKTTDKSELKDGSNAIIATDDALSAYKISGDFLQVDYDFLNFMDGSAGKYYNVFFEMGKVNSKRVFRVIGIAQMPQSQDVDNNDWNKFPFEITSLKNTAAVTITILATDNVTDYVPAGVYTIAAEAHSLLTAIA